VRSRLRAAQGFHRLAPRRRGIGVRRDTYGGGNAKQTYIGAGALVSTAEDLARFAASFRPYFVQNQHTTLLSKQEATAMFPKTTPQQLGGACITGRVEAGDSNGVDACYALGWYVGNGIGEFSDVWSHGGDGEGSVTILMYHPETDAAVAVLFARHPFNAIPLANDLDTWLDAIAGP
jgi:CubicO group peptidase (beta-lactamase class C family)